MVIVAGYVDAAANEELVVDKLAPGPPVHVIVVVPEQLAALAAPSDTVNPSATHAKLCFDAMIVPSLSERR
jgi:hypothetical protein